MLEGLHCARCCRQFQVTDQKKWTDLTLAVLLSNDCLYQRQENTEYFYLLQETFVQRKYKSWSFLLKLIPRSKGPTRHITLGKLGASSRVPPSSTCTGRAAIPSYPEVK